MNTEGAQDTKSKSRLGGWFVNLSGPKKVATIIVAVATGVTTVGGAIGVLYTGMTWLVPSMKPEPPLPVSLEGGATLSNLEVVRVVTLGDYLQYPGMPAKDQGSRVSEEESQRLGSIIRFDLELKGFAGQTVSLRWSVFDADTGEPIRGLTEQPAWPQNHVRPIHDVSKNQFETWVPFPLNAKGTYLVTLEVYAILEGNEVRLNSEEVKVSTQDQ